MFSSIMRPKLDEFATLKKMQFLLKKDAITAAPSLGCLVQFGNGIELDTIGRQFEPYRRRPCGVTWNQWEVVPKQS